MVIDDVVAAHLLAAETVDRTRGLCALGAGARGQSPQGEREVKIRSMRDGLLEANIMERSAALREAGAALTGSKPAIPNQQ